MDSQINYPEKLTKKGNWLRLAMFHLKRIDKAISSAQAVVISSVTSPMIVAGNFLCQEIWLIYI